MLNSRSVPQCKEAAPIRIIHRAERIALTPHAAGSPGSAMIEAICRLTTTSTTNKQKFFMI